MKLNLNVIALFCTGVLLFSACTQEAESLSKKNIGSSLNDEDVSSSSSKIGNGAVNIIGSGWTALNFTRKVQLDTAVSGTAIKEYPWLTYASTGNPVNGDYSSEDLGACCGIRETFRLNNYRCSRSEVRFYQDTYSSGSRQFEGYVKISSPLNNQTVMQILQKDGANDYSVALAIKGFSENGGTLKANGQVIASGIYGQEIQVNVIHIQNSGSTPGKILVYTNGNTNAKYEVADVVNKSNNMKYGCYNGDISNQVVQWRKVKVLGGGLEY